MPQKIDTHLHLIYPEQLEYPWLEDVPALKSAFTIEQFSEASQELEIAEALFMEVDVAPEQVTEEVRFIRELAKKSPVPITGIIATARPEGADFAAQVDAVQGPLLKGIRRVLHTQPDDLSTSSLFRSNVASLGKHELSFDLCVLPKQFSQAMELVDACPQTQFILDHCGVPDIASGAFEPWASAIKELAKREHLACKVSGLPTYCAAGKADAEAIRPWVEHVIGAFGWDRVVWGSDWPVCTLNSDLQAWCRSLDAILAETSESEQTALYTANAKQIYRL